MLPALYTTQSRPAVTLASDSFVRTANSIGSGWESADIGGAWTFSAIGNTQLTGTTGLITLASGGGNKYATLNTISKTNFDVKMQFRDTAMPTAGTAAVQILGCHATTTSHFRGRISISTAGVMTVRAFSMEGTSTEVAFGSAAYTSPLTFAINTDYILRYRKLGTSHKMKLWKATEIEPTAWHWTGTYTAGTVTAAGPVGLRVLTSSTGGGDPAHTYNFSLFKTYSTAGRVTLNRPATVASVVAGVTTLAAAIADTTTYPNGSTIYCTGTFYEQIAAASFAASRSLTLQALPAQSAVLSGSVSTPFTTGWTQLGGTGPVYTKAVAWTVYGVQVDDRPLLKYDTLARLQNALWTTGEDAPPEGFFSNGTTLYVRLADSSSPDGKTVYYTRSGLTDAAAGYGITTPNNTNLTMIGFRLENWPSRGISVGDVGARFTGINVWFKNVKTGVGDNSSTNLTTNHIRLEGCEYHMSGPVAAANQEYNGPWNIRKTLGETAQGTAAGPLNGLYSSNLSGRLLQVTSHDVQIVNCYIHDSFDACEVKGRTTTDIPVGERLSYIRQNTITRTCDNSTEHDPYDKYTYIEIDHNFLMDGFGIFSMAPLLFGAVTIHDNIVYISEDWYADSGDTIGKILKPVSNSSINPAAIPYTMAPMTVTHNTFVMGRSATQWGRVYETDSLGQLAFLFTGSVYRDNITVVYQSQKWELANWVLSQYNLIWPENASAQFTAAHFKHASAGGTANVFGGDSRDQRPTTAVLSVDPEFGATDATRFIPQEGSPVLAAASDGTSLGAVQPAGWTIALVGVGSAAAAYRPTLPASVADAGTYWMGL